MDGTALAQDLGYGTGKSGGKASPAGACLPRSRRLRASAVPEPARALADPREVKRALAQGELHLCYQPKLNLRTRAIDGLEALSRWTHPKWGSIPPGLFVPALETARNVRHFTDWTIARALEDQARFAELGFPVAMSVNVSGQLLADRRFTAATLELVRHRAGALILEVTETSVIDRFELALANLHMLVEAGVKIAIDDYGAGLSSLAYLRRLPAQELKIDKMFVTRMTYSQRDPLLVRTTIDLAHALDMRVTAEGVEESPTLELLRVMGCDHGQGYGIARPVPFGQTVAILERSAADRIAAETALPAPKADVIEIRTLRPR